MIWAMTQTTGTTITGYEIGAEAIYRPTGIRVILTGWSGSNNRWDIAPINPADQCPWFATTDQLTPVEPAEQPTQDSDDFPHVGAEMPWTSPDGRITIVVRRGHFTWTVETYQGTMRIADNCGAYTTENEARMVARGYAQMFRSETTPAAPRVHARPVARGHQLDMSESQTTAILIAGIGGTIDRGAAAVNGIPTGRLTDTQIRAAAARGWVKPIVAPGPRRRIIGCQPTITGWQHARTLSTITHAAA